MFLQSRSLYGDVFLSKSILKDSVNYPLLCGFFAFVVNFFLLLRSVCFLFFLTLSFYACRGFYFSNSFLCELNFIRFYHFLNVESLFEQKLTGVKQHRLKVDSSVPLTGGGAETSTRRLEGKEIIWWRFKKLPYLGKPHRWCAIGRPWVLVP